MDSDTGRIVASLNLEEIINNNNKLNLHFNMNWIFTQTLFFYLHFFLLYLAK